MSDYFPVEQLKDLAAIEIVGADSAAFLQGQLTNDIAQLDGTRAQLSGYCSPKGRLLATLVIWREATNDEVRFRALVKADIAEALVKRLSMYVLRAKAALRVTDARLSGVSAGSDPAVLADMALSDILLPADPWAIAQSDGGTFIAAPSADAAIRRSWFMPDSTETAITSAAIEVRRDERWRAADIVAGLPWLVAATQDMFIPQTLNLDLIGAVNFSKGCYPGQEVVARSHYRGKIKRRMAYGRADATQSASELAGTDVYDANRPDAPCGRVINAAQSGQMHLLIEIQLADLTNAALRMGRADGPAIALHQLPYDIIDSA